MLSSKEIIRHLYSEDDFPISFAHFMHQALYHRQYGYYHQRRPIIGATGDFITAPEISPIFSHCMAHSIKSLLAEQGNSLNEMNVLELGAGNGTMAFDMLKRWHEQGTLPKRYQILELSATLKLWQRQKLEQLPASIRQRIEWIERLPSAPAERIIIANEVLDALPCQVGRTIYKNNQWHWCEHQVIYQDGELQWHEAPASATLPPEIQKEYCMEGRIIEIPQHLEHWLAALRQTLNTGFLLIADYADYDTALKQTHPHGTLRCYHSHQVNDNPFCYIGEQDITYHLNIDLLATQLKKAGWQLGTIETQAHFLLNNGLQDIAMDDMEEQQRWEISKQIQLLSSPGEMGERFKVMSCF